jgi:CRISPR-associated endonuclease/helicase Cas3
MVLEALRGTGWQIPQDVPGLVARAYDHERPGPAEWSVIAGHALRKWKDREGTRAEKAKIHRLTRNGHYQAETIEGLHVGATQVTSVDPEPESVVIRDGERSVEVVLVRQDDRGYSTWTGQPLGPNRDASRDFVDDVAAGLLRLPARKSITDAALKLGPLPGWVKHPWLGWARALVLDKDESTVLGGRVLRYDDELGLMMTRRR